MLVRRSFINSDDDSKLLLYHAVFASSPRDFYARHNYCFQPVLAIAILSVCPSVRLSICHTGGSGKNGPS